jgi:capsular polysaccharide transport system ATP-binding protein
MSSNSFLKAQLMAILSGFVHPISGDFEIFGSLSWPLGGEGGLDSKLTIGQGFDFVSSIYSDCLEASLISVDDFFDVLQTRSIDSSTRLKDLVKEQKDFFYMMLSILFSFDIYLVSSDRSKYLMAREARPLRNLFNKQLSNSKSMVTISINNRFKREFCNRGMVLGPRGEILFRGDIEEAIDYENQNVNIDSESESEEIQFDIASHLTNSDSSSDQIDVF